LVRLGERASSVTQSANKRHGVTALERAGGDGLLLHGQIPVGGRVFTLTVAVTLCVEGCLHTCDRVVNIVSGVVISWLTTQGKTWTGLLQMLDIILG